METENPSSKRGLWIALGAIGLAFVGYLAFGVFGVHTLFVDDTVDEAAPDFATAATETDPADDATTGDDSETAGSTDSDADATGDDAGSTDETSDPGSTAAGTEATGTFAGQAHPTSGTANVLTDGADQRVLRLEDDFASDNGPDLNVYLAPSEEVGDDYIDLGDLKGNIGGQNYDVPLDVDLSVYDTVVIWCVRFGVGFGYAELDVG